MLNGRNTANRTTFIFIATIGCWSSFVVRYSTTDPQQAIPTSSNRNVFTTHFMVVRLGQARGGEAGEPFHPELSSSATRARGEDGFGRSRGRFGHEQIPPGVWATPARYS